MPASFCLVYMHRATRGGLLISSAGLALILIIPVVPSQRRSLNQNGTHFFIVSVHLPPFLHFVIKGPGSMFRPINKPPPWPETPGAILVDFVRSIEGAKGHRAWPGGFINQKRFSRRRPSLGGFINQKAWGVGGY